MPTGGRRCGRGDAERRVVSDWRSSSESIVHTNAENVLARLDRGRPDEARIIRCWSIVAEPAEVVQRSQIDVEVFKLRRPVAGERIFQAAAQCETEAGPCC